MVPWWTLILAFFAFPGVALIAMVAIAIRQNLKQQGKGKRNNVFKLYNGPGKDPRNA